MCPVSKLPEANATAGLGDGGTTREDYLGGMTIVMASREARQLPPLAVRDA